MNEFIIFNSLLLSLDLITRLVYKNNICKVVENGLAPSKLQNWSIKLIENVIHVSYNFKYNLISLKILNFIGCECNVNIVSITNISSYRNS